MESRLNLKNQIYPAFFCALYYIKILNENITNEMYTNKKQTSLCEGIIL